MSLALEVILTNMISRSETLFVGDFPSFVPVDGFILCESALMMDA